VDPSPLPPQKPLHSCRDASHRQLPPRAQLGINHTHHQLPAASFFLIAILTHPRDRLHAEFTVLYTREQEIYYHNFGIEQETYGEYCSRGFFDAVRPPRHADPITALRDSTTHQPRKSRRTNPITSQEQVYAHADAFYGAPGGFYNLNLVTDAGAQATLLEALTRDG
jgi:hypothetical protein